MTMKPTNTFLITLSLAITLGVQAADEAKPALKAKGKAKKEQPFTPERALSLYTFNRAYWESRFYDEAYWAKYLEVLAQSRFNSLVVIFGYENGGFLAPWTSLAQNGEASRLRR